RGGAPVDLGRLRPPGARMRGEHDVPARPGGIDHGAVGHGRMRPSCLTDPDEQCPALARAEEYSNLVSDSPTTSAFSVDLRGSARSYAFGRGSMRLLRYGPKGAEKPGLLDAEGRIRDLSDRIGDITPDVLAPERLRELASLDPASLPRVEGNPPIGCPLAVVPNLVCIGLNYADHARETNSPIPEEPIVFMKHTGSIIGPDDQVRLPRGATQGDWEVELGVVIGTRASYVEEADAFDYVAGYCIVNDVSERHYQRHGGGGQWIKGKSPETFAPIGPWLVTKDEIPDPQNLALWCEVDDRRFQDGSTRTMI